jgi:hypothetical protein
MYVCMHACMYVCMYVCMSKRQGSFVEPLTLQVSLKTHYYEALRHTTMRLAVRP